MNNYERLEREHLEPPDESSHDVMNTNCESCRESFDILVSKLDETIESKQDVLCPDCIERMSYLARK
jgi:hypothetical protein